MNIIEAPTIDLIEPFPATEAKRVFGWMHSYSSLTETDASPRTLPEFIDFFTAALPTFRSFGVIDKENRLRMDHEAPLIGMIALEPTSPWNGYLHVASTRRAWGGGKQERAEDTRRERTGLFDDAVRAAITTIFNTTPTLLRLSAMVLANNWPARNLAKRMGFVVDGKFEDMVTQNGEPKALVHYGMTRRKWFNEDGISQEHSETSTPSRS